MCKPPKSKTPPEIAPPAPPAPSAQLDLVDNKRVEARKRNRRGTRALTVPLGLPAVVSAGLGQ